MNKKIIFIILLFVGFTSVRGASIPTVHLMPGRNEIAIKIVNISQSAYQEIRIVVDEKEIADGFLISKEPVTVNIASNSKSNDFLVLNINVSKQIIKDGSYTIPFSLVDNAEHVWQFTLNAIVTGNTPDNYDLLPNYPNPFNATTQLKYLLKDEHHTQLIIFNAVGQQVRKLINEKQTAGAYTITWDGKNDVGIDVPSGLYCYRLMAGTYINTRKMLLLK